MNNISIRKMRIFLAVVSENNFTRAAMRENISQPAATVVINQIEDTFGEDLFERKGNVRKASLTEAGAIVADTFARIVASYDTELASVDLSSKEEVKTRRIALQSGFGGNFNPQWLVRFHKLMGGERVIFEEMQRDEIIQMVSKHEVDIGLLEGETNSKGCDSMTLSHPKTCMLVPPSHELAKAEGPVRWRDIPEDCYALSAMSDATWSNIVSRLESVGKSISKMHLYKNVGVMKTISLVDAKPILMIDGQAHSLARELGYTVKYFSDARAVQTKFSMIMPWGHLHTSNASKLRGEDCFIYDMNYAATTNAA